MAQNLRRSPTKKHIHIYNVILCDSFIPNIHSSCVTVLAIAANVGHGTFQYAWYTSLSI
jgi:hypothetical protein